jgi:hypothetical protein
LEAEQMKKEEPRPDEIQSEVGHIVHEVTGGEGGLEDEPLPVRGAYDFRQRIMKPGEPIEQEESEPPEKAAEPPQPLPPAEELPDRP